MRGTPEERFLAKVTVDDETGCWMWTAAVSDGYGHFWSGERVMQAHCWAYEHWVGTVPVGLELDHFVCDRRACVNPRHVRPVSSWENTLRGVTLAAANLAKTHCQRGHEFTPENTRVAKDGTRTCRPCLRLGNYTRIKRYRARKKAGLV